MRIFSEDRLTETNHSEAAGPLILQLVTYAVVTGTWVVMHLYIYDQDLLGALKLYNLPACHDLQPG